MTKERAPAYRFMIVAPIGRDGELICALLKNSGFRCETVETIAEAEEVQNSHLSALSHR